MAGALSPGLLLQAYASGIFPMAEHADDPDLRWVDPSMRGVFPLDGFHLSKSLKKALRRDDYQPRFNTVFERVVTECANRPETWINQKLFNLYLALRARGYAHSQEIWDGDDLIGGVFGIAIGKAFFGESMFSNRTNGSKLALAFLVDRLIQTGFTLFDTQFLTAHLASLGAIEISRDDYLQQLENAVSQHADITALASAQLPSDVIQRIGQTS